MTDLLPAILRLIIFLPLVAVLAFLAIKYGLGRSQYLRTSNSNLQVLERVTLTPKTGLCVVKIVDKFYLFSVSEQETLLVKELDDYPAAENYLVQEIKEPISLAQIKGYYAAKFKQRGKTL